MKQINSILLYVDGELDPAVLDRSVHIAQVVGAELTLASVVKPCRSQASFTGDSLDLDEVECLLVQDRQQYLDEAVNSIDSPGIEIASWPISRRTR